MLRKNLTYFILVLLEEVFGRLKMVVRLMKIFQMAILEEVLDLFQFLKVIPMLSMLEEAK